MGRLYSYPPRGQQCLRTSPISNIIDVKALKALLILNQDALAGEPYLTPQTCKMLSDYQLLLFLNLFGFNMTSKDVLAPSSFVTKNPSQ